MTAEQRHVVQLAAVPHATQDFAAGRLVGDDRVNDAHRARTHRGQIVDVGEHRGDASAERVVLHEAREQRLAARDDERVVERHGRAVVAGPADPIGGAENVGHHADRFLRVQPGPGAHAFGELRQRAGKYRW